ncbi:hypothetical protein KKB71_00230 [Patescibacteria group bacterium]|nr:hypothetical protein [Patescibacteria group bacterium]MBU2219423.1 hypothetical protein [Patescibacteria group bacterium]
MEVRDIIGIMDAFNFDSLILEKKTIFIRHIFQIHFDPTEIQLPKIKIAEIIQGRLVMDETCLECYGWGCDSCRGTGKNIQAVYK